MTITLILAAFACGVLGAVFALLLQDPQLIASSSVANVAISSALIGFAAVIVAIVTFLRGEA